MASKQNKRSVVTKKSDIRPKILLKPEHSQPILSQEFVNRHIAHPSNPTPVTQPESTSAEHKDLESFIDLLTPNFNVNQEVQDFLRDNSYFRVMAVVGKGSHKTCLLNNLLDKNPDVFPKDAKGVQLFISKDRQFILNINSDTFHKPRLGREADLEWLKLFISLLKTCHSIIFLESKLSDLLHCIRLLRCAELMDFGYDKLGLNPQFIPKVIFVNESNTATCIESLLKGSRLQDNVHFKPMNTDDMHNLIKVAYTPRTPISAVHAPFSELHWFQIVQNLWKLHKTNYFLNKYEKGSSI